MSGHMFHEGIGITLGFESCPALVLFSFQEVSEES
jgi:hypothetical protein